jgi:hypothetical protein
MKHHRDVVCVSSEEKKKENRRVAPVDVVEIVYYRSYRDSFSSTSDWHHRRTEREMSPP